MRWQGGRRSSNVQDRRGIGVGGVAGGGIGAVILALVALALGVDPSVVLQTDPGTTASAPAGSASGGPGDEMGEFVAVVLADTEDTWNPLFREMGRSYEEPTLVLFSDAVQSACGFTRAAVGPFYCPPDRQVYIDLAFFRELDQTLGAPGDFAQAYVIAHEVGHHVQTLLGISEEVQAQSRRLSRAEANALSVRQELQADCFAGIWAHHAQRERQVLEPGDIEEALTAASAIGDDRLQRQSQGQVVPESFTHGSSAQRVRWFRRGFESGEVRACDTFGARTL
jgi:predicted metalloprotease